MTDEYGGAISDEYSDEENHETPRAPLEQQGTLCKWTNYIHGWQDRYIILKDGKLSYYKNESDSSFGCRGSISVQKATVKPHDIDECRFDVCLNDCVWYLRTASSEEKHRWVDAIEQHKQDCSGLCRHGSSLSLTLSTTSTSSFKRLKGLKEKLAEIDTYRDIVVKQMELLQSYFDACASVVKSGSCNGLEEEVGQEAVEYTSLSGSPGGIHGPYVPVHVLLDSLDKHASHGINFRGEALTFKATTAGILATLGHCMDVIAQREDHFKRRIERETERRKKLEEKVRALSHSTESESSTTKYVVMGGPDYEEGPHSVIGEDDFYDAVESALDKMEEEEEFRERLRQKQRITPQQPANQHPLWPQIEHSTEEQLRYAQEGVEDGVWQLFAEDGEMKMYRRELEEDGLVMDPLKAVHQVKGITAHELVHHFWSPDVRFEWDTSIEQMTVLDTISNDSLVFYQLHKRVWPTAQRDALFWSHIRKMPSHHPANKEAHDTWIVCNRSTEHPDAPADDKYVRLDLLVCFVCQTFIDESAKDSSAPITRDKLYCKITYCSVVNPGGWVPASVLRSVYKREYPRFLKRFTQYVIDKSHDQPIAFSGLKIRNHTKHWRG